MKTLALAVLAASAAAPATSATASATGLQQSKVVVAVTRVELRWTGRLAFALASASVARGLNDVPGRLDHRVGFSGLGRLAWTATAWRDEAALDAFVDATAHRRAMREGQAALRSMESARFQCAAGVQPKSLREVEAWLAGRLPEGCRRLGVEARR
jgi:hypothetical protein